MVSQSTYHVINKTSKQGKN